MIVLIRFADMKLDGNLREKRIQFFTFKILAGFKNNAIIPRRGSFFGPQCFNTSILVGMPGV
ncbi:Uncharacterised protein [Salmonella enterica subsp. enterica serovar Bovismorbificans]|uniref:Uncharacterized protein n=1 Tax=Salmonella enterica subsp. enterica serovar Bovismorbificans TaxID=58097 RepID=A0A655CCG7_SALET|nr:Uncharacterised protein [Salmonella enterica subsp. enterica serovar Bovismorbificans]CPR54746.1 Uncharacterised protein [Salmonella enterica subsp. enterica serovar Bovismorbificans]